MAGHAQPWLVHARPLVIQLADWALPSTSIGASKPLKRLRLAVKNRAKRTERRDCIVARLIGEGLEIQYRYLAEFRVFGGIFR
jgi:hypothetical protein